ncbi:MAG TPA: hypothetical protein VIL85_19620, partial [Thermomicrobiales bacterium]
MMGAIDDRRAVYQERIALEEDEEATWGREKIMRACVRWLRLAGAWQVECERRREACRQHGLPTPDGLKMAVSEAIDIETRCIERAMHLANLRATSPSLEEDNATLAAIAPLERMVL